MEAWPDYNLSNLNKFANSYPDPNHNPNPKLNPNPNPKFFIKINTPKINTPTRSLPILLRLIHKNCGINVG